MSSNVGSSSVYEAADQRPDPKTDKDDAERFKEGKENSHKANDAKDERSIANKLERESKRDDDEDSEETKMIKEDPTLLAKSHGNEPSKGAKIDKELQDEEAEIIAKMDAKKGKK